MFFFFFFFPFSPSFSFLLSPFSFSSFFLLSFLFFLLLTLFCFLPPFFPLLFPPPIRFPFSFLSSFPRLTSFSSSKVLSFSLHIRLCFCSFDFNFSLIISLLSRLLSFRVFNILFSYANLSPFSSIWSSLSSTVTVSATMTKVAVTSVGLLPLPLKQVNRQAGGNDKVRNAHDKEYRLTSAVLQHSGRSLLKFCTLRCLSFCRIRIPLFCGKFIHKRKMLKTRRAGSRNRYVFICIFLLRLSFLSPVCACVPIQ